MRQGRYLSGWFKGWSPWVLVVVVAAGVAVRYWAVSLGILSVGLLIAMAANQSQEELAEAHWLSFDTTRAAYIPTWYATCSCGWHSGVHTKEGWLRSEEQVQDYASRHHNEGRFE